MVAPLPRSPCQRLVLVSFFFSHAFVSYAQGDDAVVKRVYSAIAVNARADLCTEYSLRLEISMYAFAKYKQISGARYVPIVLEF